METRATLAGWRAFSAKVVISSEYSMMSIFSPRSSRMMDWTRMPFMPTQAPTGSTSLSRLMTADLGALAGFAGDGADADGAVVDLGDFGLE